MGSVIIDWLWALNEFFKCFLVVWGVLGYSINKRNIYKKLVVFIAISWLFIAWMGMDRTIAWLLLIFAFGGNFLEGNIPNKIKAWFISVITITIIDLFMWSLLVVIFPRMSLLDKTIALDFILDLFWVLLVWGLFRYRKVVYEYFTNLSFIWVMVLVCLLLGMGMMTGSIQYMMENDVPYKAKSYLMLILSVVTILVVIGCIALSYNIISQRNMKLLLEKEQERYLLETKFYKERLKQNEEIQRFRHDIKKHMKIIRQLCDDIQQGDSEADRLKEYVDNYLSAYPEQIIVYTGHIVSDYFLSELISAVRENPDFQYNIMGKFPEKITISDADLSILLGNALDNAKEELLQIEGFCYFGITIKNYNDDIMIKIENTKAQNPVKNAKAAGHGYGTKNMKEIVERYQGNIEITDSKDMFCVKILLANSVGNKNQALGT